MTDKSAQRLARLGQGAVRLILFFQIVSQNIVCFMPLIHPNQISSVLISSCTLCTLRRLPSSFRLLICRFFQLKLMLLIPFSSFIFIVFFYCFLDIELRCRHEIV